MTMDNLAWTTHPAKSRKKTTAVLFVVLICIFMLVYYITYSMLMVIFAILLFTASLSTYFFPTNYEITKEKIKVRYLFTSVEKDMGNYRSYYPDKSGVLLSPFLGPSRLENFRGLYLRYQQNKEEVDVFIKQIFEARESGN